MFEAQNKSQPKLVYTNVGTIHSSRDQEVMFSPVNKTNVADCTKDMIKVQEKLTHKFQDNETKILTFQSQQSQLQQKQEMDRRGMQTNEQIRQSFGGFVTRKEQEESRYFKETLEHIKQSDLVTGDQQQLKHESERREIHKLEQQKQPKQIEIGYISTKKGSTANITSAKTENTLLSSTKQSNVVDNENEKKSPTPARILNNSSTARRENTLTLEANKDQGSEIKSNEKLTNFEKVEYSIKPAAVIKPESKSIIILSSSSSEHQVSSMRNKTSNNNAILNSSRPTATENSAPKKENVNSSLLVKSQELQQQNFKNQQEQKTAFQPPRQQKVHGDFIKEAENIRQHVTAIKVHSFPMEQKQIWPLLPQSDHLEQSPETPNTTTIISHQLKSQTPSFSTKVTEQISKSYISQDPIHTATSQSDSTAPPTTNPPKSILKNSISFNQTDMSYKPHTLAFSESNSENIPRFGFKALLTGNKDTVSRTKDSSNMFKRQNKSIFTDKINSPPPQRKGRKFSEDSISKDGFNKVGLVSKKSVTFDSQVLLHLDDQMSAVETLPVDA